MNCYRILNDYSEDNVTTEENAYPTRSIKAIAHEMSRKEFLLGEVVVWTFLCKHKTKNKTPFCNVIMAYLKILIKKIKMKQIFVHFKKLLVCYGGRNYFTLTFEMYSPPTAHPRLKKGEKKIQTLLLSTHSGKNGR